MDDSARLFNCVRCQRQVVICSDCDRGNIYCAEECSRSARQQSLKMAGQRYQQTLQGKQKHALRQQRYRQRQKDKVTHQGSPDLPPDDLLPPELNEHTTASPPDIKLCHFCRKPCSSFLRIGFLSQEINQRSHRASSWPRGP